VKSGRAAAIFRGKAPRYEDNTETKRSQQRGIGASTCLCAINDPMCVFRMDFKRTVSVFRFRKLSKPGSEGSKP
jgi:hypothetical protein